MKNPKTNLPEFLMSPAVVSECVVGSVEQDKHFRSKIMDNLDSRNYHWAASVIIEYFTIQLSI